MFRCHVVIPMLPRRHNSSKLLWHSSGLESQIPVRITSFPLHKYIHLYPSFSAFRNGLSFYQCSWLRCCRKRTFQGGNMWIVLNFFLCLSASLDCRIQDQKTALSCAASQMIPLTNFSSHKMTAHTFKSTSLACIIQQWAIKWEVPVWILDEIHCSTVVSGLENSVLASSHCFGLILKENFTVEEAWWLCSCSVLWCMDSLLE